MTKPRIFVSYSRLDSVFTERLVRDLKAQLGVDVVWIDVSEVKGGDEWKKLIVAEITNREIFLLVLSPNALAPISNWVPFEMNQAHNQHITHRKKLIPLMLQPPMLQQIPTPLEWRDIQHIDFTGQPATYVAKLAELLDVINATPGLPLPGEQPATTDAQVAELIRGIDTAAGNEQWQDIIDMTDLLRKQYPQEMTPNLWRWRGRALLSIKEVHDAKVVHNASVALGLALELEDEARKHASNPPTQPLKMQRKHALNPPTQPLKMQMLGRMSIMTQLLKVREKVRKAAQLKKKALKLEALADEYTRLVDTREWARAAKTVEVALKLAPNDPAWLHRRSDVAEAERLEKLRQQLKELGQQYDAAMLARQWDSADKVCAAALQITRGEPDWLQRQQAVKLAREEDERRTRLLPISLRDPKLGFHVEKREFKEMNETETKEVEFIVPPMAEVDAGPFYMGTRDSTGNEPWHLVPLEAYAIGKYPVTVAEYALYLKANPSVTPPSDCTFSQHMQWIDAAWRGKTLTWALQQAERADHPVVMVSWFDACKYAAWLAAVTGEPWRLPTEAEWEKAARYDTTEGLEQIARSRIYPWGNQFDILKTNIQHRASRGTTRVGYYADAGDVSKLGCHDMIGNVWEWTSSLYVAKKYPDDAERENMDDAINFRVLRGGSWKSEQSKARGAVRGFGAPNEPSGFRGFRLACGRS